MLLQEDIIGTILQVAMKLIIVTVTKGAVVQLVTMRHSTDQVERQVQQLIVLIHLLVDLVIKV